MVSLTMLEEMSNGDVDFIREMITIYQEDTPLYVVELEEAVIAKDWDAVSKMAHKMKSSTKVLGADNLVVALSKLENIESNPEKAAVVETELQFVQNTVKDILAQLETLKP